MLLEPVDPNERFRSRRRQARRRRAIRRTGALAVVALAAAGTTLGARFLTERDAHVAGAGGGQTPTTQAAPAQPKPQPRPYPAEIRGVHVTMALASVPGKIDEYLSLTKHGLNTLELDVKDENGEVGFRKPKVALAREVDAAKDYYDPVEVAQKAHAAGVYLIGRIVCFEDPTLTQRRAGLRDQDDLRRRLDNRRRAWLGESVRQARLGLQRPARHRGGEGRLRRDPVRLRPLPHRRRPLGRGLPPKDEGVEDGRDHELRQVRR